MRYIIGIDLGTTNSCVAFVDTDKSVNPSLAIQMFRIPQWVPEGFVAEQFTLPSFCYLLKEEEKRQYQSNHQLPEYLVGSLARSLGAKTPTRIIQSAKSWLCHSAAHRKDPILPESGDAVLKISPVEATTRYLRHIREAWNTSFGKNDPELEFEEQEVILTVPASFDEVARTLTVEAAKQAGFGTLTLLEEPQAAFYSWLLQHQENWKNLLHPGEQILVCDVGGGTTDFSLIEVVEKENQLGFQRMAVGNHLLLGGDNMDLAIAHYLEKKLPNMNDSHWPFLLYEARQAKEKLLSDPKAEICPITLLGTGSHVIQGSLATQIKKDELLPLLLHGFFGNYNFEEASQIKKSSGIRTMGLPFENEPSITKHLAAFLRQNQAEPDYVLFNGGTLKPKIFQEAITNSLHTWFKDKKTQMLSSFSLDLAVARGAAYYGKVRRGLGVKIGGGLPRSFYLEVAIKDAPNSALTIMPRGSEEGSSFTSQETFYLSPNTPVAFNLFSSHTRLHDEKGSIISLDPLEMQPLPAIHTVLRFGKTSEKIPVKLEVLLTAIGTLELWLSSLKTDHRWKLEFQIKSASGQENALTLLEKREADETFDSSFLEKAKKLILDSFSEKRFPKPEKLMEALEVALERPKQKWSPAILRGLFDPLLESVSKRKQTHAHEMRFWNLAGFLLRPGFGYPLDDFRIKEFWKIILAELQNPTREELWIQQLICYRRISGGLNKGQQMRIASEIFPKSGKMEIKGKKELYLYIEKIRTLASFELLDLPLKQKIGEMLLKKIAQDDGMVSECWALGRIGARRLFYGPFTHVIPKAICQSWIEKLLQSPHFDPEKLWLPIGQMARKTDHREINLEPSFLKIILEKFQGQSHYERLEKLLYHEESQYSLKEQEEIFGEELPMGLSLD